jgi:hypothetical protein
MGSVSSDDDGGGSERCGSYSLSADVSESESCTSTSSFSCRRGFGRDGGGGGAVSSSMTSSPRPLPGGFCFPAPVMVPVIGGKDVVVWDSKNEKRGDSDLSGNIFFIFSYFCRFFILTPFFVSFFAREDNFFSVFFFFLKGR